MTQLTTKLYEIDLKTIILNYKNEKLWGKKWTVFEYNGCKFSFMLETINTETKRLGFKLYVKHREFDWEDYSWESVYIHELDDLYHAKKRFIGRYVTLLDNFGDRLIERDDLDYQTAIDQQKQHKQYLEKMANSILDENKIEDKKFRDPFIAKYVSDNSKSFTWEIKQAKQYSYVKSEVLTLLLCFGYQSKFDAVTEVLEKNGEYLDEVIEQANEFYQQFEKEVDRHKLDENLEEEN